MLLFLEELYGFVLSPSASILLGAEKPLCSLGGILNAQCQDHQLHHGTL